MIKLELPFPPSMNTYWRNLNGRTLLSVKGRRYKSEVIAAVYEQLKKKPKPIADNVAVKVEFYPPSYIRRDIDNYFKALFDSLTTARVWLDDSQIKRIEAKWCEPVKNGNTIISIITLED